MKIKNVFRCIFLVAFATINMPTVNAQGHQSRGPISRHTNDHDPKADDEYRMSHLDADAGDLIGLVLPQRLLDMHVKNGRWDPAESSKVRVVEYTNSSANIRLLSAGTTVVNYKYKYMKDGKEESASYPFTIRIHRIDPELISLPSTLYLGWDVAQNLASQVKLQPEYSESPLVFSVEDPTIADIDEGYNGPRITGRELGETMLHVESANGLHAVARVVIGVPALKDIDIVNKDKRFAVGDQMQLELKLTPFRAQPQLTWSSDNPNIVTVDQNGVVTAVAEGKATIRVISDNGEKDSITLKVKN